jgi:tetratricopeptide (TPR) repeat protein
MGHRWSAMIAPHPCELASSCSPSEPRQDREVHLATSAKRGFARSMRATCPPFLLLLLVLHSGAVVLRAQQGEAAEEKPFIEQAREAARKGDNASAVKLYEMALQSSLKILKEDDIEVVMRRAELGEAYRAVGRWDDAIPQLDYAWKRLRYDAESKSRWLEEEGSVCLGAAEKLGRAYQGAARYEDAAMVFSTAIADCERVKRDDADLINFDALLADTLLLLQRDLEAEKVIQHAQDCIARKHADDPATQARLLSALGTLCYHHRRFERARIIAEKALLLAQTVRGIEATDYARYQDNLGATYVQLGRLEEAERLIIMARKEFLKKFSPDAPELLHVHVHLAEVSLRRGRYEDARAFTEESLRIARLNFPEHHPEVAKCLQNLATVWLELKQPGKAGDLCAKALMINEAALGKDHPRSMETRVLLEKIEAAIEKKQEGSSSK